MNALAQRTHGTYMVGVIVGDQHTHDVLEVEVHLLEVLVYGTRGDAGINQYAALLRAEVVAVAATSATK